MNRNATPISFLQVFQQVHDFGLNGHIKRRDAFVADHEIGARHQRAGNADTLALPARKGVRKAAQMFQIQLAARRDLAHAGVDFVRAPASAHPQSAALR